MIGHLTRRLDQKQEGAPESSSGCLSACNYIKTVRREATTQGAETTTVRPTADHQRKTCRQAVDISKDGFHWR